ncbi:MAG: hypothetical protein IJ783_10585, partial [Kiritimatiellae bacterium]|nr:hypothetical protein [Kiritimatiellia bacterium]
DGDETGYTRTLPGLFWHDSSERTVFTANRTAPIDNAVWTYVPPTGGGRFAVDVNGLVHWLEPDDPVPQSLPNPVMPLSAWTNAPAGLSVAAPWFDWVADGISSMAAFELPGGAGTVFEYRGPISKTQYARGLGYHEILENSAWNPEFETAETRLCSQIVFRRDLPGTVDVRTVITPLRFATGSLGAPFGVHGGAGNARCVLPRPDETVSHTNGWLRFHLGTGTDPLSPDTDRDGIPDGWEHSRGLDPFDPSDAAADPDADGLSNLAEYENGADPCNPDTDGDGVPDGTEVSQGSDPACTADGGEAPPQTDLHPMPFLIGGDWAAWEMEIAGVSGDGRTLRIAMESPGAETSKTALLRKGATYRIRLHWRGSGEHSDPTWHCWEARLGENLVPSTRCYEDYGTERLPGNETLRGNGWHCENGDGLFTAHVHESGADGGNLASGLVATLHVHGTRIEPSSALRFTNAAQRVRFALSGNGPQTADWAVSPVVPGGPKLHAAATGGAGAATVLRGAAEVWLEAGSAPGRYSVLAARPGEPEA